VIIEPLPLWYQPEFTYTDTDAHDMSFCFTSEHLRHIEITDQVHDPTEMTPFADVQYDAEIRARARNCSIHWRAEVVEWDEWKSKLVVTDMLLSPLCWQERQITRLARSLGCDYEERGTAGSPQRVRRQDWVAGLYEEADLRRQEARAAIDGYGLDLNNSSLDTLGHGDIEEL